MMTKKELIRALMNDNNLLKEDAEKVLDMVADQIKKQVMKGREVRIDGVGRFSFKYYDPRDSVNNFTGKEYKLPRRVKLKFKPFPSMRAALNDRLAGVD